MNVEIMLFGAEEQVVCSSLDVAHEFKKRHDNVLRDIQNLDCSENFRLLDFEESSYTNEQGKEQPMFLMNRDGFVFLVFGYRGEKAAAIRETYIALFNQMEKALREKRNKDQIEWHKARFEYKPKRRLLTDAIKEGGNNDPWEYKNLTDLINKGATGMNAAQLRKARGAKKNVAAVDLMTTEELQRANELPDLVALLKKQGLSYKEMKPIVLRKQLQQ